MTNDSHKVRSFIENSIQSTMNMTCKSATTKNMSSSPSSKHGKSNYVLQDNTVLSTCKSKIGNMTVSKIRQKVDTILQ
jgi:hypothetical protein